MRRVECEEIRELRNVPKDSYFRRVTSKGVHSKVYVKGDYDYSDKRFCCYSFECIGESIALKGNTKVLVGFTF